MDRCELHPKHSKERLIINRVVLKVLGRTAVRTAFTSMCCELILRNAESHQVGRPVSAYLLAAFTGSSLYKCWYLVLCLRGLSLVTLLCCQYMDARCVVCGKATQLSHVLVQQYFYLCISQSNSLVCFHDKLIYVIKDTNWKGS